MWGQLKMYANLLEFSFSFPFLSFLSPTPKETRKNQEGAPADEKGFPSTGFPLNSKNKKKWCGTSQPNPKSQSFSQSYGSSLPTSLTYIVPVTRGCSPWRPAAVMSTVRQENVSFPLDFQGSSEMTRTLRNLKCSSSLSTLSLVNPIPEWSSFQPKVFLFFLFLSFFFFSFI